MKYKLRGNSVKKNGLSLAEILTTIAVVGIVSAMTIPSLVNNTQQRVLTNSLPSAILTFENVLSKIMIREGRLNLSESDFWTKTWNSSQGYISSNSTYDDIKNFKNDIGIFTTVIIGNMHDYYGGKIYQIDKTPIQSKDSLVVDYKPFETKKGNAFFIKTIKKDNIPEVAEDEAIENGLIYTKKLAEIIIDINGKQKPNIIGRDIFYFSLNENGKLIAKGGNDDAMFTTLYKGNAPEKYSSELWETKCSDTSLGDGSYCTGRLIANEFKMEY